jgi:hypothetical protein
MICCSYLPLSTATTLACALVINKTVSLYELPQLKQAYTHIHTDNFGCTTPSSRTALLNQISNAKFSPICPQFHCSHVTRIMAWVQKNNMLQLQEHCVEELAAESRGFAAFVHFFSHKMLPHVYLGRSCFAKICSSFSPLNWKHSNLYLHFKRLRT